MPSQFLGTATGSTAVPSAGGFVPGASVRTEIGGDWQRPWETMRDRSTFAMSFACAFATDAFADLSRTFLKALRGGAVENPPPHSAEATARLEDIYQLHQLAHGLHAGVAQTIGLFGSGQTWLLQGFFRLCALTAFSLFASVHLAFVNPSTQVQAMEELSQTMHEILTSDAMLHKDEAETVVILRLAVLNSSWPQEGVREAMWLQQTALEAGSKLEESENESNANTTMAQNLSKTVTRKLTDFALWGYDLVFPTPSYEFTLGASNAKWLEIQSPTMREALGVRVLHLNISAQDPKFFGPQWARELISSFRLYDLYVLNAIPRYFVRAHAAAANADVMPVQAAIVSSSQVEMVDLRGVTSLHRDALLSGWPRLVSLAKRILKACWVAPLALVAALVFSALLRRLAVLTMRMQLYAVGTAQQIRRYAFIAEPMRRVNCYSSNELLELWTAWALMAALAIWLLFEAHLHGPFWCGFLLCYAVIEYWGIIHVRTVQSRWIFPRAAGLLHSGVFLFATWWPLFASWLLLWVLVFAQISLMSTLLCQFDCYATLPEQPPHRLLIRSLMLPARELSREKPFPRMSHMDKAVQTSRDTTWLDDMEGSSDWSAPDLEDEEEEEEEESEEEIHEPASDEEGDSVARTQLPSQM